MDGAKWGSDYSGNDQLHRLPNGAKNPFCDKLCPVHNCVRENELNTCADCTKMDECPTLGQIAANSPFVLENLKRLKQDMADTIIANDVEFRVIV